MKGLLTSTLTGLALAVVLTTPALAETTFSTLAGIPAEAMTEKETDKGLSDRDFQTLRGLPAQPLTEEEMDSVEGKFFVSGYNFGVITGNGYTFFTYRYWSWLR